VHPDRLRTVESIFHDALDIEPQDRDEFVRHRCGGDENLRRDVEALLTAQAKVGEFIESPIFKLDSRLFDEDADRLVGQRIGHWELLKRIGSGGMGAVYLARRADLQFEQQAAIKLVKRGMDTEAVLRRFRNERQILAGFDHPNIARLLDGDTTDDGLPYFVMEYVEGLPIDQYCERQALGVTHRLQLFRQVCAAVSYAHRRAVIHRDLKTSNILVTADGTPKLLDFGIARLLEAGESVEAAATMLEQRVMTPEYASPEQLRGESVTTASDVYSLGVVLYRLLTGQPPYRLKTRSVEEMERTVGQTEPQRPSAVTGATGGRRLRGDLDNIVLMAMRKEPERRYSSVEQFSEDVRRHIESLPVLARRDTLAYRTAKFVRRNTAVTAAAALVVLSLVGGIAMTTWQARRARTQEAIAIAEKARAERRFNEVRQLAHSVIFDYHDAIRNLSGATAVRARLMKDGLAYLDSLAREAGGDPALQRELAAAYDRLGDVRGEIYGPASLGDLAGATESYSKALRIRGALVATSPDDVQSRRDVAASYRKLGGQLTGTGDVARGIEYLRKGIAVQEQLAADHSDDLDIRQELAAAYHLLGIALEDTGDARGALESHREALAVRESLVAADPANRKLRRGLAITLIGVGRGLVLNGDFRGGIASNRKALAICEALLAEDVSNADYRRLLANTYQNDGDYRAMLGDVDGALQSFRKKLTLDEQSLADDADNSVARSDLAYTRGRMADLLAKGGRYGEALSNYREALVQYERLGAESSENPYLRFGAIFTHGGIGEMHARLGEGAPAIAESSRAMELLDATPPDPANGARSSLRAQVYMRIAATYAALGESPGLGAATQREHWRSARELYVQSLAIWEDMQKRGILTADDAPKPQDAAREIKRCDASLRQLS
jgi:tetratricopeptide (TPR) repeat protein/tRNA A-37 threonylcarbamoyl transferase component Bud32